MFTSITVIVPGVSKEQEKEGRAFSEEENRHKTN